MRHLFKACPNGDTGGTRGNAGNGASGSSGRHCFKVITSIPLMLLLSLTQNDLCLSSVVKKVISAMVR